MDDVVIHITNDGAEAEVAAREKRRARNDRFSQGRKRKNARTARKGSPREGVGTEHRPSKGTVAKESRGIEISQEERKAEVSRYSIYNKSATGLKGHVAAADGPSGDVEGGTEEQKADIDPDEIDEEGKAYVSRLLSGHFGSSSDQASAPPKAETNAMPAQQDPTTFVGLGLDEAIEATLSKLGFKAPTDIQACAIPVLLSARDALIQSPTGTGKTICYLAPLIQDLRRTRPRVRRIEGALAIVVVPTRELSMQVFHVASKILQDSHWIVPGVVMGGEKRTREKARLRKGINVLVCTPGRLLDHLENTKSFVVSDLRWLVFDEADRLLDLGFKEQLEKILQLLDKSSQSGDRSKPRQNVMISATMHGGIAGMAKLSLRDPASIGFDLLPAGGGRSPVRERGGHTFELPELLTQCYINVPAKLRVVILYLSIARHCATFRADKHKVVVFVSCCNSAEFHHRLFTELMAQVIEPQLGVAKVFKLHGNMTQQERTGAYFDFCRSDQALLFCTDVAARGLDFPKVTCIVQYDPPGEPEEYVHRVGRTARIGANGESYLFLLPSEVAYVDLLRNKCDQVHEMRVQDFLPNCGSDGDAEGEDFTQGLSDPLYLSIQQKVFQLTASSAEIHQLAGDGFRATLKAYATYPHALKKIFNVKRLHTGHIAHSFGLKDRPSAIARAGTKDFVKKKKRQQVRQDMRSDKKPKFMSMSE